jgi:1,6-anhydro-N-acetylmuramate kinase
VPAEAREALCWAVLGALARDGVRVALPRVTGGAGAPPGGAAAHLSGTWILRNRA